MEGSNPIGLKLDFVVINVAQKMMEVCLQTPRANRKIIYRWTRDEGFDTWVQAVQAEGEEQDYLEANPLADL